jgi:hypothetical protein
MGVITRVYAVPDMHRVEDVLAIPYALDALATADPMMDDASERHIKITKRGGAVAYVVLDSNGKENKGGVYCMKDTAINDIIRLGVKVPDIELRKAVDETFVIMDFFCSFHEAIEMMSHFPELAEADDLINKIPPESLGRKHHMRTKYRAIMISDAGYEPPYKILDISRGAGPALVRKYLLNSSGGLDPFEAEILPEADSEFIKEDKYPKIVLPFDSKELAFKASELSF